uniref:Uncharacterized protein n=1 Tax=Angiostrongylus cantonensis TaxID=6313 RepID=A0A0K0DNG0_ANGCA
MQPSESAVESECRKDGLDLVEYPLYRIVQVFYTLVCFTSLPLLLYVGIKYIFYSTFHRNIKIYDISSSIVNKPCDFFPPVYVHASFHMAGVFSTYGMIVGVAVAADYAYDTDHFNVKLWSMIYVPPGAEAKFNHVASLNIIICFVCIATFQVLSRFNKKQCSV